MMGSARRILARLTAEGCVKDDSMVLEIGVDVGIGAIEDGRRCSPSTGVRRAGRDVRGNTTSGEEPDLDGIRLPFHCVDTPTNRVEIWAITGGALIERGTSSSIVVGGVGIVLAVISVGGSGLITLKDLESIASMKGGKKSALIVGTFKDVNFTVVGPGAISQGPKGRPGAAASRGSGGGGMLDVCDEQTLCPLLGGLYPDTGTTDAVDAPIVGVTIIGIPGVDTHLSGTAVERDETISLGPISVDVSGGGLVQFSQGRREGATYVTKPCVGSAS